MKTFTSIILYTFIIQLLGSCSSMLPVNSYYEKAGTLQEGNIELSGNVTGYSVSHFKRTEKSNDNFGFRFGYGVNDRFDLKLRYENQEYTSNFDYKLANARYVSLVPKYAFVPKKVSLSLPFSFYFATYQVDGTTYKRNYTAISPLLLYTYTGRSNKTDITFGVKSDFIFGNEGNTFLGGLMGMGLSTNLDKWAIRPEVGVSMADNKEVFWNYGIGLQFMLFGNKAN